MVKTHELTDRTYRYENRNNMSIKMDIEKKERDYNHLQLNLKKTAIKYNQLKNSYNFLYPHYCKLYELYSKSDEQNTCLETAYDCLNNKYNDLNVQFDDLKNNYNNLLSELHEEEQVFSPRQSSSQSVNVNTQTDPQQQENIGHGDYYCAHV